MMGPTHKLVGGSTAFVATTAAGMPMTVVVGAVICATVASPMPDHAEKVFHLRHRRLTHRPSVQLAFFAVWGLAGVVLVPQFAGLIVVMAASLTVGCVMHSVADSMTVEKDGIQLLWPLSRRGYHLLPWSLRVWVGTKSRSEKVFVVIWCAFVLIYAYARFRSRIYA
jgi:membrane-bound metal-dependent hydrolase YbcI (DUF457 family)